MEWLTGSAVRAMHANVGTPGPSDTYIKHLLLDDRERLVGLVRKMMDGIDECWADYSDEERAIMAEARACLAAQGQ